MKTSDDGLIRRAQALDAGALAELYDRYFDGIYRYAYTRIGHQADAEDLTEQVFLKMVDSIQSYRPRKGAGFSSWLYRIAHNLVVDRYRRAGREALSLADHVEDPAPRTNPELVLQSSEDRRHLYEAIQQLTPEQQQLVALRFIDNLDVDEVAQIMKRRPGAIHSMQHRALASLNRLMAQYDQAEARRA